MSYTTVTPLLTSKAVNLTSDQLAQLEEYVALIRRFQPVLSLVSRRDLDLLEEAHVTDALSLVPCVVGEGVDSGRLVDLGSGAGFPAIPLKIALPWLEVTLVERQTKRVGFLQKAIGALGLRDVKVVEADFPKGLGTIDGDWVTARAVEKPAKVVPAILSALEIGTIWLDQMGHPKEILGERFHVEPSGEGGGEEAEFGGKWFHVEPCQDAWTQQGLRRGPLWQVWRVQ